MKKIGWGLLLAVLHTNIKKEKINDEEIINIFNIVGIISKAMYNGLSIAETLLVSIKRDIETKKEKTTTSQCDSHELLFKTMRTLSEAQGQVIPLSTILHKTNLLDLQVERDLEMTVTMCGGNRGILKDMNITPESTRASVLQLWGSSPWLLCSDCLQRLNLDKIRL